MPAFEIKNLDHVVLRAFDAPRLVAFYRDVLGCTVERVLDIGLTQLRAGASIIDVVAVDSELGRAGRSDAGGDSDARLKFPNLDHFCLRIEPFDADELERYFARHSVQYRSAARVYGAEGYGPAIYIQDPEDNTVELKGGS